MKYNIPQQLKRTFQMFFQESGIDDSFFLICVGIQVTTYILHPVEDMPGFTLLRSFKNQVFYKMGHSLLILCLIARSSLQYRLIIRRRRPAYTTSSVDKGNHGFVVWK